MEREFDPYYNARFQSVPGPPLHTTTSYLGANSGEPVYEDLKSPLLLRSSKYVPYFVCCARKQAQTPFQGLGRDQKVETGPQRNNLDERQQRTVHRPVLLLWLPYSPIPSYQRCINIGYGERHKLCTPYPN